MVLSNRARAFAIARLNDDFRQNFVGGAVLVTIGVSKLCEEVRAEVLSRVRSFTHFTKDNDPYGEHDFGSFELQVSTSFGRSTTTTKKKWMRDQKTPPIQKLRPACSP
jgi:hypothetical protein